MQVLPISNYVSMSQTMSQAHNCSLDAIQTPELCHPGFFNKSLTRKEQSQREEIGSDSQCTSYTAKISEEKSQ